MPTSSKFFRPALALAFSSLLLASCESTNDSPTPTSSGTGNNVYVVNEGAFTKSSASITFYDKVVKGGSADIFQAANARALGDVAQSMSTYINTGYIVVNNSNKIEVVALPAFKSVATINGLVQPRYMVSTSAGKGFVTEWLSGTAGRVSVINLATNTVTGTVPTGRNPEKLLSYNGRIFVPNSDENTVTVIDAAQNTVVGTVTVSDGPSSLVADKNGNIWVLCGGITRYGGAPNYPVLSSTPGTLFSFDPNTLVVRSTLPFAAGSSPSKLRINAAGDQLYYSLGRAEYQLATTATALPTTPLIRRSFYGFDIDPSDNTLYGCVASFSGNSKTLHYRPDGTIIDSLVTGIGSNGVVFY